jgi:hypothetical protein
MYDYFKITYIQLSIKRNIIIYYYYFAGFDMPSTTRDRKPIASLSLRRYTCYLSSLLNTRGFLLCEQ